jgi:lipoprotein-anchoring transpeptidase ErfK/SrfK
MGRLLVLAMLSVMLVTRVASATEGSPAFPPSLEPGELRGSVAFDGDIPHDGFRQEAALLPAEISRPAPNLTARMSMAPKLIARIKVGAQTMDVVVEGEVRHSWKVSTGAKGYRTPRGVWSPYRMHTMWRSRKYDNAPMPHSIFFTGGYAIHATPHVRRLGTPASHGCVRLHPDHARELFELTLLYGRAGTRVVISD